jgi:hypothetical protein
MKKILGSIFAFVFIIGGFLLLKSSVFASTYEDGCSNNQNYSSTTGALCQREQQFTGFLTESGPSNTMWGTHVITNDGYAVCIMAPCPSANLSYLVNPGGSDSVLADLIKYENSRVKIIGTLEWIPLGAGFWGIVATEVIPLETNNQMIKVISPNGGEKIIIGQKYNIKWKSNNLNDQNVNIYLKNDSVYCRPGITGCWNAVAITGPTNNDGSYLWDTNKNLFGPGGPNSYTVIAGANYRIKVCSARSNICDESDDHFKLIKNTTNTPVISGISGPQNLSVNQMGTWKVLVSGSKEENLSYSVNWGDEYFRNSATASLPPFEKIDQQATFTHTYSRAGVYSPVFRVTNESGLSAETSLSVNVGNTYFTPRAFERTLRIGVKGEDVRILQSFFGIKTDGFYGRLTAAKVREWQAINGLNPDGVFGPASRVKAGLVQ